MSCWDSLFNSALSQIGAPQGGNSLAVLNTWFPFECPSCSVPGCGSGGCNNQATCCAANNPLATTECDCCPGPNCIECVGGSNCNSFGVKNYPTQADGACGLARTFTNGYYPSILAALRADWTVGEWACSPSILSEIDTWGTSDFATYLGSLGCISPTTPTPPTPTPPTPPPTPTPVGIIGPGSGNDDLLLGILALGVGGLVWTNARHPGTISREWGRLTTSLRRALPSTRAS